MLILAIQNISDLVGTNPASDLDHMIMKTSRQLDYTALVSIRLQKEIFLFEIPELHHLLDETEFCQQEILCFVSSYVSTISHF